MSGTPDLRPAARPDRAGDPAGAAHAAAPAAPATTSAAPAAEVVVELDDLRVGFGRLEVLKGLSARLTGRAVGLLGPNGAGKTTLLHTLLGFYPPRGGTARVFGHDVRSDSRTVRSLLGYMPERDAFIGGMNGVRYVRLMAELAGLPPGPALERAHEALFYVGLGEARYRKMESYSLGMKQLAKLAQALVHGPRLLLLDEPTAGLDPPARERMLRLIREIRATGEVAIILSSHLLRDVDECCDTVVVLKDGRIAAEADLAEERRSDRRLLEVETRGADGSPGADAAGAGGADDFVAAVRELGCELAVAARGRLKLVLPPGVEVRDLYRLAAERRIQLRRVGFKRDSLEDIFLQAMEGRPAELPTATAPAAFPPEPEPEPEEAPRGGL